MSPVELLPLLITGTAVMLVAWWIYPPRRVDFDACEHEDPPRPDPEDAAREIH